jgi:hypothetical protein
VVALFRYASLPFLEKLGFYYTLLSYGATPL